MYSGLLDSFRPEAMGWGGRHLLCAFYYKHLTLITCEYTGDNIDTVKKNTQTLSDANKENGLEVNTEKTKYMLLSRRQNAKQNHGKGKVIVVLKMWHS
jgi:hypothetical protein